MSDDIYFLFILVGKKKKKAQGTNWTRLATSFPFFFFFWFFSAVFDYEIKVSRSVVFGLPPLNDLRLNERSARGRSLVALELLRSARSVFVYSSVNKRSLSKPNSTRPEGLVCVSGVLPRHLWADAAQKHGGASGKGWCTRPRRGPPSAARLGQTPVLPHWECLFTSEPNSRTD